MTNRHIAYMSLAALVPADVNPKMHDIPSLVHSLTRYGWTSPAEVDERTGRLVSGHGRREAIISMRANGDPMPGGVAMDDDGDWMIPVLRGWSSRDDVEAMAYLVAANRIGEAGGWHMTSLAALLEEVVTADAPLMETLGWSADALDDILNRTDTGNLDTGHDPWADDADTGGSLSDDVLGSGSETVKPQPKPRHHTCPDCGYDWEA